MAYWKHQKCITQNDSTSALFVRDITAEKALFQGSAFTHQSSTATDHTMESVDSLYSSLKSPLTFMNSSAFIERNAELDAKLKEAAVLTANRESVFVI